LLIMRVVFENQCYEELGHQHRGWANLENNRVGPYRHTWGTLLHDHLQEWLSNDQWITNTTH